jgi:DNA polymerase-2
VKNIDAMQSMCEEGGEREPRIWEVLDNRISVHYPSPPLRVAELAVEVRRRGPLPSLDDALVSVRIGESIIDGSGEGMLRELQRLLRRRDPDVIVTENGDSFVLPYLYGLARRLGLEDFTLGREGSDSRPTRKERTCFSYGRVIHKNAAYYLKGRLHIDRSNSFLFQEGGLEGVIDMSRLSGIPMQRQGRTSPGTAISAMEVNHVLRSGRLVPWKKNLPEDFKSLRSLLSSDRGGFIYEPNIGLHEQVLEVDFASMYPHIMVIHNISPETVNCRCCRGSGRKVPGLEHHTCEKRLGLIPIVLAPLVKRRLEFKRLKKKTGDVWDLRSRCLKPLLVTCFGYTGYRNAPFGRIECHEAINAHGRDILIESSRIAERHGFAVLHGIVDSMWLKGPIGKRREMIGEIARTMRIPLSEEGIYRWLVFLPDKMTGAGALNRYYGLFENSAPPTGCVRPRISQEPNAEVKSGNGEFKLRGIALRRHDTPELVRSLQKDMLAELAKASGATEFMNRIPKALEALRHHAARTLDGKCALEELVLKRRVSRTLEEYAQLNETHAALRSLKDAGVTVPPGESIRFVLVETESGKLKGKPEQMLDGNELYDRRAYYRLLVRAASELLVPFGYDEPRLERILKGKDFRQEELA